MLRKVLCLSFYYVHAATMDSTRNTHSHSLIRAGLLCALLVFAGIPLSAQHQFTITPYTVNDGMPSTNLRMMAEDEDGFIWCGTEEGLIRFDGYTFKTFRGLTNAENGLADNRVMALLRDLSGHLWVATARALHRYEPLTQTFHRYPYTTNGGQGPAGEWIQGMFKTADGTLWVLSNLGLSWYDSKTDKFNFAPQPGGVPTTNDQAIFHAEIGHRIWFISNGHLLILDRKTKTIKSIDQTVYANALKKERRFRGFFLDPARGLVIAGFRGVYLFRSSTETIEELYQIKGWATGAAEGKTAFWISLADGSLLRYDARSGTIEHIPAVPEFHYANLDYTPALKKLGTAEPGTRTMFVDRSEVLWIAFQNRGLLRYDYASGETTVLATALLKNAIVRTFLQDRNGTIWLTIPGIALVHIEQESQRFPVRTLSSRKSTPSLVPWNNVRGFLEWSKDSILIASLSGLFVYDRSTGKSTALTGLPPSVSLITTKTIWSLARDHKGRMWIGTGGDGLLIYDLRTREYMLFSSDIGHPFPIIDQRIRVITMTPDGRAILGTWKGISIINADSLDLKSRKPVFVEQPALEPASSESPGISMVMAVATDNRNRDWIGTDNGLYMRDPRSGQSKLWKRGLPRNAGLISDDIRVIHQDRQGRIWIGTHGAGLQRFNDSTGITEVFDMSKGLPDNIVYSIEQDAKGNFWLGTHRGLCRLNPLTGEVRSYDESDGLQNYEFNTGSSLKLFDGAMMFGGVAGFNIFYPDSIHDQLSPPNVVITRVLVQEKERPFHRLGIKLPYDQNYITFEYAALSHYHNEENRYAHMLVGVDNDWVHTDTRRYASYSNLPPGEYEFRVIACNSEGRWNLIGASMLVVISPAWWKSNLALAAYGLSVILLIALFVNIQRRRATQKERIRGDILTAELRAQAAEAQATVLTAANELKELELRRADELRAAYDELARAHEDLKKLSQAVHQSPAIVIITNTNGEIEYVNPKFTEVTGYTTEQVLGKNPRMLKSNDSSTALYRELWKTLASGKEWRGELKNKRSDGSSYWVLSSISPLKGIDGTVTHYIGIQEDITMRKKTEEILARRNEELETIDRIVEILNWEFDFERLVRSLIEQGLKLIPHAKRIRIFIYEPTLQKFILADALGMERDLIGKAILSNQELLEGYLTTYEIADHGISILRDAQTELEQDEQTPLPQTGSVLLMSVRFNREHVEEDGFVVFDVQSGDNSFNPDDARRLVRYREHAITALAKAHTLQTLQERNDELLRTQEQLVVQQKLASLGQLTAGIAHEIRNPLNFINNFALTAEDLAEELQTAIDLGNDPKELLSELRIATRKIHEHGSRADRIVGGMLLHARSQHGERQATLINRLVQDAIHLAYHGMRATHPEFHVTLKNEFDAAVGSMSIVTQEISRVVLSLLDNSFYAVWKLICSVEATEAYVPTVRATTKKTPHGVEIRIWDNGGGMPAHVKEKIFNPFFTTKPAGEGTGLGLSLSHDVIVKEHGGTMAVESKEGAWTEIIITLPDA
ncbi:MAG: two-component regulator propeller domain-containing protein [Bacteroidota bacterium]